MKLASQNQPLRYAIAQLCSKFDVLRAEVKELSANVKLPTIVTIWLFWVVLIHLFPLFFSDKFPVNTPEGKQSLWPYYMEAIQTSLSRWDSRWFHEVVEIGYYYRGPNAEASIRFYPMYPLMIRFLKFLLPINTFQAGTATSAISTLFVLVLLGKSAKDQNGSNAIFPTISALLWFPSAFVLATVYSESTTLFFFLTATRLAKSKKYVFAGLAAFAAALSRINGFLILLPLLVIAVNDLRKRWTWRPIVMLFIGGLGVLAFPCYLWMKFGDPFLYFRIHTSSWTQTPQPFYSFLKEVFLGSISALVAHRVPTFVDSTGFNMFPVNLSALVLMFWTLRRCYVKQRWEDAALMAGGCLLAASAGNLLSLTRLAIVYYPIPLRLGEVLRDNETVRFLLPFVFLFIQIILLTLFVRWHFIF
jgi:hypothetical protein